MKLWKLIGIRTGFIALALFLALSVGAPAATSFIDKAPEIPVLQSGLGAILVGHVGQVMRLIGPNGEAYAATPDFIVDGTDDHLQAQLAVNALPVTGGKVIFFGGNYNFSATVSRAIPNVTIEGSGKSTYFAYNAATAIFSAGAQTGWVFKDFRTDTGWLTLGTDTRLLGALWKGTELVSNVIASGATMPASPVVGQEFYQDTTGRDVLYSYNGSAWQSMESFGPMTLYVDSTDGTDAIDKGTGVDANAFKTIQYAWNFIPPVYGGNVIIYINNETYNESLVLHGNKWPKVPATIYFSGTLSQVASATMDSAVTGTGATQGSVTDAGAMTGYDNKLIYANSEYRLIDSATANTANICGVWSGLPAGTYTVYNWGTTITGTQSVKGDFSVKNVLFEKIKFDGSYSDVWLTGSAEMIFQECWFAGGWIAVEWGGQIQTWYSLIDANDWGGTVISSNSNGEFINSKFRLNGVWTYSLRVYMGASAYIVGGTVFDGLSLASGVGIWSYINGSVLFDIPTLGYPRLRNYASVACSAETGGQINTTANNQYNNNGTDEWVVAASYGYVD